MRKLIVAAAAMLWAGATFAGDYHVGYSLKCSECHTMHASRTHNFGNSADIGWEAMNGAAYPATAIPNDHLLIQAGVNMTCLACHDNTPAPDVFATNEQGPAQLTRSAGALNGPTIAAHDSTGYDDWMGHTLGATNAPPGWDGSATGNNAGTWDPADEGFHCGNCHSIHGSTTYRNLGAGGPVYNDGTQDIYKKVGTYNMKQAGSFNNIGPTYNPYVYDASSGSGLRDTTDVAGNDIWVNNADRTYVTSDIEFRVGSGGMNTYCAVCHGMFHNNSAGTDNTVGANGWFIRHPTTGQAIANPGGPPSQNTTALLANMANARVLVRPAYTDGSHTGGEAACLSCHKGHGNQRGFALMYPKYTAVDPAGVQVTSDVNGNLEQGDQVQLTDNQGSFYPIRNLCVTCHVAY